MKGFFIQVTNNLLDPKHCKNIDVAVWEFMWCLDKITKIDDQGVGWVLGGKPVNIQDFADEIGRSSRQIIRNLNRLEQFGYIRKQRTPYGIRIWVAKAKKQFKRDVTSMSSRSDIHVTSNIRQIQDIKNNNEDFSSKNPRLKKPMDYERVDEGGYPLRDNRKIRSRGFQKPPAKEKKPESVVKMALRIHHRFAELCKKQVGITPVMEKKGRAIIYFALGKGKLNEKQIYDLFDEWFGLGKPDDESVQITRALSANQINAYKARNGVTEKSTDEKEE